jgi:hypothetical protein
MILSTSFAGYSHRSLVAEERVLEDPRTVENPS